MHSSGSSHTHFINARINHLDPLAIQTWIHTDFTFYRNLADVNGSWHMHSIVNQNDSLFSFQHHTKTTQLFQGINIILPTTCLEEGLKYASKYTYKREKLLIALFVLDAYFLHKDPSQVF